MVIHLKWGRKISSGLMQKNDLGTVEIRPFGDDSPY
jgi:hypothetical protein